jgi:hypothetical protein
LKRSFEDGGYTVIDPETRLSHVDSGNPEDVKQSKRYIAEHLQTNGIVVTNLVDRLFERNNNRFG